MSNSLFTQTLDAKGGKKLTTAVVVSLEWCLHALLLSRQVRQNSTVGARREVFQEKKGGTMDRVRLRIFCLFLKFGFEIFISLELLGGSRLWGGVGWGGVIVRKHKMIARI